jgi:hypothetical protein
MSFHPQTRVQLVTGDRERWCPYCRATAPLATPLADWAAAHGPCQTAASLLPPEELFHTYIARNP